MGEDVSDMATTTSQLQAKLLALTGGKVDIMLDENTFKNSTQILREMAAAWEDMTDVQRASALELMGGKRQANVLSALIQNFDTVEEVIETSANSAGSALKENERYLDSIQGKIDQFNNATQAMWSNLLDADWIKGIVEIGTWLIKLIDGVEIFGTKIGGVIPTLLTLVAVITKLKKKITWSEFFGGIGEGITKLNTNLTGLAGKFGILGTSITTTNAALQNLTVGEFNHAMASAHVDEANRRAMRSQMGLTGATNAQTIAQGTLTAETLKEAVANGILNSEQAVLLANKYGLTLATVELTSATAAQIMTDAHLERTQKKRIISALGLTMQTKTLTKEELLNILAANGVVDANERAAIANLFFKETNKKLGLSFKALGKDIANFIKKNALLIAITAAVAAIALIIKRTDELVDTLDELEEKLSESQNALESTTSELKSLKNELEEVNEAIQALQTQGTLSFTDQEELNRLRDQRRELESAIALKSQLETTQQKIVNKDAQAAYDAYKTVNFKNGKDMGTYKETGGKVGAGVMGAVGGVAGGAILGAGLTAGVSALAAGALAGTKLGAALGSFAGPIGTIAGVAIGALVGAGVGAIVGAGTGAALSEAGDDVEEKLDIMKAERDNLEKKRDEAYKAYVSDPENEKLLKKYEEAEGKLTEYDSKMAEHVAEIQQMRNQMDWTTATPSQRKTIEEMDDFIDRYNIIMKSQGAVGNAIERILGYDRYDGISERIQELVEEYKKTEDENILTQIAKEAERVQADLADVGLSIQDVVDYYTPELGLFDTSTIEGATGQYLKGIELMQQLADNTKPIEIKINNKIEKFSFDDLFEKDASGRFKAKEKEFSEMLKGMDERAQNTFKKFAEGVKNNEITWSQAMDAMKHSANLVGYEFVAQQIAEANAETFKSIQDDINGTIDTFGEFSAALEDVAASMDLLYKAQTQMNTAGRLSVKTALEIIESTGDWEKVLDITNGTITLQENATETLIQSKLDLIGANIENEIQQLEEQKSTILAQGASNDFATTIEESTNLAIRNMAGSMAYLTTMMEAYTRAANGEKINTAEFIERAGQAKLEAINGAKGELDWKKNSAEEIGLETINERLEDAKARRRLFNQINTVDGLKDNYDFDEKPGDKYNEDEDDELEKLMEEFQEEMDDWENRISANQAKYEQIQNEIDLLEKKGQKADASYYAEQIELEGKRKTLLEGQKAAAQEYLGILEEGSEEWWEVANTLNDIENELDDVTSSILDLQDAIGEIETYKFEEFNTRLDNLVSKLDTIGDLIAPNGEEDWFSSDGSWTDAGIAVVGRNLQKLELFKQGYQETMEELAKYQENYAGNEDYYEALGIHSEQEWYDKIEELISQQYDFAESISDTEQSIVDMYESNIDAVEEYIETLIDGYSDYIDSVKEALEAERSLYEFKKNVQKQTKDIAEIERRIASLSGSTNKADIAERRKLEAQLYESRESLNDTYYDHAQNAQQDALDAEQEAYETAMTSMVEKMRVSLEEATTNMAAFLDSVTIAVSMNADTVLEKYRETEVPLNDAITNPWEEASEKVAKYGGDANNLMDVWKKDGYFAEFKVTAGANLSSPWSSGTTAANTFKSSVSTVMSGVVSDISTNVKTASEELSKLYQQIIDTENKAKTTNIGTGSYNGGSSGGDNDASNPIQPTTSSTVDNRILSKYKLTSDQVLALGYGPISLEEFEQLLRNYKIKYSAAYAKKQVANMSILERGARQVLSGNYVSGPLAIGQYAKGTTGTTRDEWAITDEPQFGDELTMYATPEGTLSFMRAGSTVVPADITKNLVEWGQFTPDSLNLGSGINLNMINNAVNKPEFNFAFDALVKAENITEETLPAVKKLVTQELNRFTKELNYALKGKGAR